MNPIIRSGSSEFKPKARLIRTIGEELISNDIVAIIELVKNSYDANASIVVIDFSGKVAVTKVKSKKNETITLRFIEKEGTSISITDDGYGMNLNTIENAWMQPATNFKKNPLNKNQNRRFTGEKGIGRFASSKLADQLHIITKQISKNEIIVDFDWTLFSNESVFLDEIKINWYERYPELIKDSGTSLVLKNITSIWDEDKIRELRVALSRLLSPITPTEDFLIELKLPKGMDDFSGLIERPDTINKPDYLIKGKISATGIPTLKYFSKKTNQEEEITSAVKDFYLKKTIKRNSQVGEFAFEFRVWNRENESLKLLANEIDKPIKNIKADLDELSGISIYRDNFRVLPYGNKNNDWLRLDKRRVNNPTMRLSNNQIIGYISIGLDSNPELKDQSNREGLVDNQSFEDLKEYVLLILNELEIRRYNERPRENTEPTSHSNLFERFSLKEIVKYINANIPQNETILKLINKKDEEVKEGLTILQNTLARYRRLSTLGFMVDIILHDGGNFLNKIDLCSKRIEIELGKEDVNIELIKKKNSEIIKHRKDFNQLFRRIEPFGGRKRGRPKQIVIEDAIKDQVLLHQAILKKSGIEVKLPDSRNIVTIDESELGIIIMNLLQNSIYWLDETETKEIRIEIERQKEELSIIFSDSGPGIREDSIQSIFEPYFSTKPNGIGLGLTIVGEIVSENNGEFALIDNGPLPGATFKITFKYRV